VIQLEPENRTLAASNQYRLTIDDSRLLEVYE
jgi:hypothetical protein